MSINHLIDRLLTGHKKDQRIQYWSSFEDHKKKIRKEIYSNERLIKELINDNIELAEEYNTVSLEEKEFNSNNYKPSYSFTENFYNENKDFCDNVLEHIKYHELAFHKKLIGNFYDHKTLKRNIKAPTYIVESAGFNPLEIKYIRCEQCYKDFLKGKNTHFRMNIQKKCNGGL